MRARDIMLAAMLLGLAACQAPSLSPETVKWQKRLAQVQLGMSIADVERILIRPSTGYSATATITGSARGVVYFVAPGYCVRIFYSHAGKVIVLPELLTTSMP